MSWNDPEGNPPRTVSHLWGNGGGLRGGGGGVVSLRQVKEAKLGELYMNMGVTFLRTIFRLV